MSSRSDIKPQDRVLFGDKAASVKEIEGDVAYILMDTQRPSSDPKPVPLSSLRLLSKA